MLSDLGIVEESLSLVARPLSRLSDINPDEASRSINVFERPLLPMADGGDPSPVEVPLFLGDAERSSDLC